MSYHPRGLIVVLIAALFSLLSLQALDFFMKYSSANILGETTTVAPRPRLAQVIMPTSVLPPVAVTNSSVPCQEITRIQQLYCQPSPIPIPSGSQNCKPIRCDANHDGIVNITDLATVQNCWNKPATGTCAEFDYDCNNIINIIDFQKFTSSCPQVAGTGIGITATPTSYSVGSTTGPQRTLAPSVRR